MKNIEEKKSSTLSSFSPLSNLSSQMYSAIGDCVNKENMLWNGRYQVKKEIGKGQYGKVFLARDANLFNGNK